MPQDDAVGSVSEASTNKRRNLAISLHAEQHMSIMANRYVKIK